MTRVAWIAATALLIDGLGQAWVHQPSVAGTVTGPGGEPAAEAVVYLVPTEGGPARAAAETTFVDQNGLRFVPRVIAIAPGSLVVFPNSDPVLHNVFSPEKIGAGFDLGTYPRTERRMYLFFQPGVNVVLCHVHPEMVAYVVVVPTAYRAVTDDEGRFRIDDVPAGSYRVRVWHRRWRLADGPVTVVRGGARDGAPLSLHLTSPPHSGRHVEGLMP